MNNLFALLVFSVASVSTAFQPLPESLQQGFRRGGYRVLFSTEDEPLGLVDLDDAVFSSPPSRRVMSQAIPFLECPKVLVDCDLAGNVGFDPLGFAKNKGLLMEYREAEIKHARLAMLAAAGWPLSEEFDPVIAAQTGLPRAVDEFDRAPSVLNGGLEKISPVWWGFCLGLTAAIDLYGVSKARADNEAYFPGKLDFDPLNLYPKDEPGQQRMQLCEIKHGRLAMISVIGFVVQEYVTKEGVVDETPWFFRPIFVDLV